MVIFGHLSRGRVFLGGIFLFFACLLCCLNGKKLVKTNKVSPAAAPHEQIAGHDNKLNNSVPVFEKRPFKVNGVPDRLLIVKDVKTDLKSIFDINEGARAKLLCAERSKALLVM
jgi:hypothetical protein